MIVSAPMPTHWPPGVMSTTRAGQGPSAATRRASDSSVELTFFTHDTDGTELLLANDALPAEPVGSGAATRNTPRSR